MSSALLWECVKKGNAFLVKGAAVDGALFSREAGNLAAKHSYKYSGERDERERREWGREWAAGRAAEAVAWPRPRPRLHAFAAPSARPTARLPSQTLLQAW